MSELLYCLVHKSMHQKEDALGSCQLITKDEWPKVFGKPSQEPVYINSFDKPVFNVTHAHIKKVANSMSLYELQINDNYYQITEEMLEAISRITYMDGNVGISIG